MGKLWNFFDNYLLKICVSFLIFFVALYPKLPSVHITHTWVYIRLEDFSIAITVFIWFILLLRKKVRFPLALGSPIVAYWIFGFLSLVFSLIFIGPHLLNFFPSIAILSYLRRIEYMILFFIAFSSIRSVKDAKNYLTVLITTVAAFTVYGFGQKFYLYFWNTIPSFFLKHPFCFPSFQTGNEEFAKGIPLCLPFDGRITSTFAGHYDLAAYLVLVIPIFLTLLFVVKRTWIKALFSILILATIVLLILTASRISFPAYLIGSAVALTIVKRKKLIIPLVIISIALLPLFSSSTARRFMQTFRFASVVVDNQGHVVGEAIPKELNDKLARDKVVLGNIPTQNLPQGSGFIGLPTSKDEEKTDRALVRSTLTPEQAKKLKLENGGVELSTIKGNFTLKKAIVYDISFTTRLQSEWPNALRAFSQNIFLGAGFSTITLATDNDYLRFLGESGMLGLLSFISIFIMLFILFRKSYKKIDDPWIKALGAGLFGGIIGLIFNATLFDIFEASKVAETLWILTGITSALFVIGSKDKIDYLKEIKKVLSSHLFIAIYLTTIAIAIFSKNLSNFFVADDFTWLKWAATSTSADLVRNFTDASGFFYRPLDKTLIFVLHAFFAFKPEGYHAFMLALHIATAIGVYLLGFRVLKNKLLSFSAAFIFMFLPIHAENLFWISTVSTNLSTFFIVYSLLFFSFFRERRSIISYVISLILFAFALFSYETSLVLIPLLVLFDALIFRIKPNVKNLMVYAAYLILSVTYLVIRHASGALGFNGDYSYSLPHFIPNAIGNFIGYLSSFIFGESALPLYTAIRNNFRSDPMFALSILLVFSALVLLLIYAQRNRLKYLITKPEFNIFSFGILFALISLIPFLGLGNISERYNYLASIGFSISLAILLGYTASLLVRRKNNLRKEYVIGIFLIVLGLFYYKELRHSAYEWQNAGKITNRTLTYLKVYHENIPKDSNLYFVNTPIRFEDAWVFPVGLPDGIWFLYGDRGLNIKNVGSVEEARMLRAKSLENSYIFKFDKDLKVGEVQ